MKKYKTKNNLQEIWDQLDAACGSLENALTALGSMCNIPTNIEKSIEAIDFSAIADLKNEVEALIEQVN